MLFQGDTMIDRLGNVEDILRRCITGFHQYIFGETTRLSYVSDSLCQMLGCTSEELTGYGESSYADMVHPADAKLYAKFMDILKEREQTLTEKYRLVKKDGSVIYVNETVTVIRTDDGTLTGYSSLSDITDVENENTGLRFLSETISCGLLKYTCDKQPKIMYINKKMLDMLRFPEIKDGGPDCLDLYKENIYLMIPMEERHRFSVCLEKAYSSEASVAGEMSVMRFDGTKAYMFGWITKVVNEHGQEEFQTACVDITEHYNKQKKEEENRYINALSEVYSYIFLFDFSDGTVKCVHSQYPGVYKWIQDIPMRMEDAIKKWVSDTVDDGDIERVGQFFRDLCIKRNVDSDAKPPVIKYRAKSASGKLGEYSGIFLKMGNSSFLFCCRSLQIEQETDRLKNENLTLKNMNDLVMKFTDSIVAFEVENDTVKPLYTSDNICSFFGYTKNEWMALTEEKHSIKDFISHSGISYDAIQMLFSSGEAEFTYYDAESGSFNKIKAICSRKGADNSSCFYVILYNVDSGEQKESEHTNEKPRIKIRTFGYFDIFVDGRPIAFRSQKSKELFALLVDRRGGFVSSEEAISFLWEDEPISPVTLSRYRKVALRLKNILEEYGIADAVETVDGKRRIVTERVECDLYNYLSGKEEYSQLFKGSYLTNYSWGETTLAELSGSILY